jgi:hypothetical protein
VRRIRRERNAAVPDVDPDGPGVDADVLVVLRDPGPLGALKTSCLSVNATAANQRRLFAAPDLPSDACLFWNAVPWDLEGRRPSREAPAACAQADQPPADPAAHGSVSRRGAAGTGSQ